MASTNRLISQFNPESYNLSLSLNKQTKKFSGQLSINGSRRSKPSYRITLNQNGLKISSARIFKLEKNQSVKPRLETETEIEITRIVHHRKLQEVRLHSKTQITSGKYRIELEYSGKVATKGTSGIYTSTCLDPEGKEQEIITTQFEPHYARALLPCIDEPEAKAIFNLNLSLPTETEGFRNEVLFNTPIDSEQNSISGRFIKFKPTPRMSTYLLALIVGDLKSTSRTSKNGTKISVITTPHKLTSAQFSLDFATKVLDLLEGKFKVRYPLEKLDLVAVPDFDSGGMENWGLITFREDLLLFDEELSTLSDKQSIALVIAHEIAHQWFGNLVTMKWWDELWLNEGFANFMEYYVVDCLYPEWKMQESYLVTERSSAVRIDSLPSSRPIVKKVSSPHEVVEIFDVVAYEKSGNIIRMIFSMIGEEAFMKGLNEYFIKFSYKSATSEDLLACWQKHTKLNLKSFTKNWLYKPGIPLVDVSVGTNQTQIKLSQSRFLSEKNPKVNIKKEQKLALKAKPNIKKKQRQFYLNQIENQLKKTDGTYWHIPVSLVSENTALISKSIMTKQTHKVQLSKGSSLPLKLNANGESFFVVNYSIEFLARLSKAIQNKELTNLDTLNLLSDIVSLNRAGQFGPGSGAILDIIKSGSSTTNSQFWSLTGGFIGYIHYHLKQTGEVKLLSKYLCALVEKPLKEVGIESKANESPEYTSTRFELLALASLSKDSSVSKDLLKLYDEIEDSNVSLIEPEKRLLVLYAVAKRGKKSDYKNLLEQYKSNLEDVNIRDDLSYGLGIFEDSTIVQNNLEIMQDSALVRSQDVLSWLALLIGCSKGATEATLSWILKHGGWNWLNDNLSPHDLSTAVKIVMSCAFTTKDLNKFSKFFSELENMEIEKALAESLDVAKSRISWHKKELPSALDYLSKITLQT